MLIKIFQAIILLAGIVIVGKGIYELYEIFIGEQDVLYFNYIVAWSSILIGLQLVFTFIAIIKSFSGLLKLAQLGSLISIIISTVLIIFLYFSQPKPSGPEDWGPLIYAFAYLAPALIVLIPWLILNTVALIPITRFIKNKSRQFDT